VSRVRLETRHAWAPGPLRPLLAEHAVHVWRADLSAVSEDLAELLSSDESARAERFASAGDAERWRRSRGLLRALLGRYLQREPRSLRFTFGEHGKPALAEDADASSAPAERKSEPVTNAPLLSFNMSHSGQLALYAFSRAGAVGIDVEVVRRPIDEVAVASRALGAATAERLRTLEQPARRREFLAAWARHEAQLKCLGVGIGGTRLSGSGDAGEDHGLWLVELEMEPDVAAAVAAEHPARELRRWDWRA
jgi:4'-phosphopantetheinyl transferase